MGEQGISYDDDPFEDIKVRHAFVRKVFGVVSIQLLITLFIAMPFVLLPEARLFALNPKNMWIAWVCLGITLVLMFAISCCKSVRRSYPLNFILLFIFTLAMSTSLGFSLATRYPMHVLMALGITIAVCVVLIVFACQVKWDFTGIAPFLIVAAIILMIMGIVAIFIRNRIFQIVYNAIGVFLVSIYLIVDVQMMLGGKHKYQFDPEDWAAAALALYMDIITIFIYILNLLGLTLNDE